MQVQTSYTIAARQLLIAQHGHGVTIAFTNPLRTVRLMATFYLPNFGSGLSCPYGLGPPWLNRRFQETSKPLAPECATI